MSTKYSRIITLDELKIILNNNFDSVLITDQIPKDAEFLFKNTSEEDDSYLIGGGDGWLYHVLFKDNNYKVYEKFTDYNESYFARLVINVSKDKLKYNINISSSKNGKINISANEVYYKDLIKLEIIPNLGYELDSINIYDNNNQKIELNENEFIMPNSNVTINATFKPIEYHFVDGENAAYQNNDLVFTLDGEYDLVDKVIVNGNELDFSNYTIAQGSTVLTLKNDYLKSLKPGTYELTVTYTNGSSDTTTFKINEKEEIITPTVEDSVDNPKTFDGILFYVYLGLVSIIGLTGAGIYFKKYAYNKTR